MDRFRRGRLLGARFEPARKQEGRSLKPVLLGILIGVALLPCPPRGFSASNPPPDAATDILEAAFVNRYSIDLVVEIELVMHGRGGQTRERTIRAATKVIDGLSLIHI